MRFLKSFLIVLTGLFIIITLLSLFIPSTVKISRTIVINTNKQKVYEQIATLKNWQNWHPTFKNDAATLIFSGNNSCDIKYNNKIAQLRLTAIDSSSVKFTLASKGENAIANQINILPLAQPDIVCVEWVAYVKLKWYPWEKVYGMVVDKIAGPGYDEALKGLKDYVELK